MIKFMIWAMVGIVIFSLGTQAFHEYQATHPWRASILGILIGLFFIRWLLRINR